MNANNGPGDKCTPLSLLMLFILALVGIISYFIIQITNQPPTYLLILACMAFVFILYQRYIVQQHKIAYAEVVIQSLVLFFIIFLHTRQAYGLWDAWAQWTPKALFLGQGTNAWKSVFSNELGYTHPGYPLLSPTIKALIGASSPYFYQFSIFISSLFSWLYIQISGELFHVVSNKKIPKYAGLLLLLIPGFIPWIASQYADITLGCFIAAAVVCYLNQSISYRSEYIGFFLGAALFTKDEGMLYVIYFVIAAFAQKVIHSPSSRIKWKTVILMSFPGLLALILVKAQSQIGDVIYHAPKELTTVNGLRIATVVNFMSEYLLNSSKFLFLFPAFTVSWIVFLVRRRANSFESTFMGLFITLSFVGMGITYLLTYLPLRYHIEHSSDRLVVQFLPIIIAFITAMAFSGHKLTTKDTLVNDRV